MSVSDAVASYPGKTAAWVFVQSEGLNCYTGEAVRPAFISVSDGIQILEPIENWTATVQQ